MNGRRFTGLWSGRGRRTLGAAALAGLLVAVLASAASVGVLPADVQAASEMFVVTQLTSNSRDDMGARVSGDRIVWQRSDGADNEIFTWTPGGATVQVTSNGFADLGPQVSGDRIAWSGFDGPATEIFTWTPAGGVVRVTTNSFYDGPFRISGDRLVWSGIVDLSSADVFTWTPAGGTVRLTTGGFTDCPPDVSSDRVVWTGPEGDLNGLFTWTPDDGKVQLTSSDIGDQNPRVSGDRVVWMSPLGPGNYTQFEIFTWTPEGGILRLTTNDQFDEYPQVDGDRVVWAGYDGHDREIFTWTPAEGTTQLCSNSADDQNPRVSGDRVVWMGEDGTDFEIFAWSSTEGTTQLTSNSVDDMDPHVSGDRVVWTGRDATDYEVFTAVAVPTVGGFGDVPVTHPYSAAIGAMAQAGIIKGFSDDTFRPDAPVTRQQFAKMITKALDLEVMQSEPCPFRDVALSMDPTDPLYPRQYVAACAREGITQGRTADTFAPYANITRAQLLTMVVRGAALFGVLDTPTPAYYAGTSEGTHRFRSWNDPNHGLSVRTAEFSGLLEGILLGGDSGPAWYLYQQASRGEVAEILWRLQQKIEASSLGREIRVGVVSPLTGYLAVYGMVDQYCVGRWLEYCGGGVLMGDGKKHRVAFLMADTQSDVNRAASVTADLVRKERVDLVLVGSLPETVAPVADTCEYFGVPCISTDAPWQNYLYGRGGSPEVGFTWTYHFCWGLEDVMAAYLDLWSKASTDKVVGIVCSNGADGYAFKAQFPPALEAAGYKVVDPAAIAPGTEDFTSVIAQFRRERVEIVTGVMIPPDFTTFWKQSVQQGFSPDFVTVSQALRFPYSVDAIGDIGVGLTTEVAWSSGFPFPSSLTGETAGQLAADFQARTGQQWVQALSHYALGEIAMDVLGRAANPKNKESVLAALQSAKLDTIIGPVDFTSPAVEGTLHPVKNVYRSSLAAGQWIKGTTSRYDLRIVGNAAAPLVPLQGEMELLP